MSEYPTTMVEFALLGNLNMIGEMNLEELGSSFNPYLDCTSYLEELNGRGYVRKVVSREMISYEITDAGKRYLQSRLVAIAEGRERGMVDMKRGCTEHYTALPAGKLDSLHREIMGDKKFVTANELKQKILSVLKRHDV